MVSKGGVWLAALASVKFAGIWTGPALIVFALYLFIFPPMPFIDVAQGVALAGAIITAIVCIFLRAPKWRQRRKIMALAAMLAITFFGWRYWDLRRGYSEQTVSFDNRGARLVGTLYVPDGPRKRAGVVFLTGSGAIRRGWFRGYVSHFARRGFVILIYDKRGAGESSGQYQAGGSFDLSWNLPLLAEDAAAAAAFLASRPEVSPERVGFVGFSEGGIIAPRAAELHGKAQFLLVITSTTASVYRHSLFQATNQGMSEAQAKAKIERYFKSDFDPSPSLRALNIPGLWVLGELDRRTPNAETIRIIEGLRKSGKPYEYRIIPGAWHGLFVGPRMQTLETIDLWLARVTQSSG